MEAPAEITERGELKEKRIELFNELLAISEKYKHKNQYQ